jgi:uncharacterized protein YabE (DUF348 family)
MTPSLVHRCGWWLAAGWLTACALSPVQPTLTTSAPTATPSISAPLNVSVVVDGQAAPLTTAARTVGEALAEAHYRLYLADRIAPALDQPVTASMTVTITRSRPMGILADGRTLLTRTLRATVGAVLSDVGLALVGMDYAVPAADQPLPPEGLLRVVRVREEMTTAQETIPFETHYQARADWEIDTVQAVQAGRVGLKERRTRVRYEDGVEVSRVDEGEFIVQEPQAYLIGYGTNIVIRTLDTPDGPIEYWRSYQMYATSYAAKFTKRPPDSPNYGRTASGKILVKGLVAIDRRYISFGTRMYVPGYGFAEAADTGGGVKGRWIDLGFDDWNYEGWHWKVTVYFLTPTPPADQIVWIIPSTVP